MQPVHEGSFDLSTLEQNCNDNQFRRMDILFYDCANSLKRSHSLMIAFNLLKVLVFTVFIPIDQRLINSPKSQEVLGGMILAIVASAIQFISLLLFRCIILNNNECLLDVASKIGHATDQKIPQAYLTSVQKCVSKTIYNHQNHTLVTDEGLTQKIKIVYLNYLTPSVKQFLVKSSPSLKTFSYFAEFVGLVAFFLTIAVIAKFETNTAQFTLLIAYSVMEGLTKIFILLMMLLLALSPLICLFMMCYICSCHRSQEQVRLPASEKFTQSLIQDAGGSCSICYQSFTLSQNVKRLECSPKHMFHELCIEGWAKIKATCPICRTQINNSSR